MVFYLSLKNFWTVFNMSKSLIVIGSGFAGLSAAALLAKQGYEVTLLEKNKTCGGRAALLEDKGFKFDMGPSWYWMPEVFEDFFKQFGKKASDYYQLTRLDPAYKIYYKNNESVEIPADLNALYELFESREEGAGAKLEQFLKDAEFKYKTAMADYVNRPSHSLFEFIEPKLILQALKLDLFSSLGKSIRKQFKDPLLISILEFPSLFLGSTPAKTPALYSMMNYADLSLGTWYPQGGMYEVAKAFTKQAEEAGVKIITSAEITEIKVKGNKAVSVVCSKGEFFADIIVSGADYRHTEQCLLPAEKRQYSKNYWENREMSPSALLFYLGLNTRIEGLLHHSLFFDEDFDTHADAIYGDPQWPEKPLFYVSAASKTDSSVVPDQQSEGLVILIPLAPGLKDGPEHRDECFEKVMKRLEARTGQSLREHIVVKHDFAISDFSRIYNSFKGNAYGLANTLMQTAFLKPKMKHPRLDNFYYTGQLTVPGPGVPPAIISGQIVSECVVKDHPIGVSKGVLKPGITVS